eukprot:6178457-Pleurochrysis_carterae.AAC.1
MQTVPRRACRHAASSSVPGCSRSAIHTCPTRTMSTEATATGADANTTMVKMDLKELDLQQPLISSEEQKKKTSGPVPPELCDPLTGALLKDPVRANDGFVYDQDSLSQWFEACKAANKETHSPASYDVQPMDPVFRPDDATALQLDAYLTSAPNALTGTKNLQTLCSIFDLLPTKLSDMLATSLESWTPPTVVFFGNSSSGKSSLIERLAMVPLPRAETPCTRMAVILKLRHTMRAKLPRLCVVDSTTGRVLKEQARGWHSVKRARPCCFSPPPREQLSVTHSNYQRA